MTYSSAWLCHKAITLCLHKSLVNLPPGSLEDQHHQLKEIYSIELNTNILINIPHALIPVQGYKKQKVQPRHPIKKVEFLPRE